MASTLRQILSDPRLRIVPVAHDALSARLIQEAGFELYAVGGFPLIGFRYALPDIGIVSFGEMLAGVRDVMMGSGLPIIVDADDGYGDAKNVARTVQTYEAMGVAAITLEDQVSPKRCGHMAGKSVVTADAAVARVRAAVAARQDRDFVIIARTDALAVHGLEDTLWRAERLAEAGADVLFVEAPTSRTEVEEIARRLRGVAPLLINMPGIGRTPFIPPEELGEMGYSLILSPAALMVSAVDAMRAALRLTATGEYAEVAARIPIPELAELFGIGRWAEFEQAVSPD